VKIVHKLFQDYTGQLTTVFCTALLVAIQILTIQTLYAQEDSQQKAWVNAQILNIRMEPAIESTQVGQLSYGEVVQIIEVDDLWSKIQAEDKSGWVYSPYIRPVYDAWINPEDIEAYENLDRQSPVAMILHENEKVEVIREEGDWAYVQRDNDAGWTYKDYLRTDEDRQAWVTAEILNVREAPSLDSPVITRLSRGESVYIQEEQSDWAVVNVPGGRGGWVATPYLSETQVSDPALPGTGGQENSDAIFQNMSAFASTSPGNSILQSRFSIGMSKEQVIANVGQPQRVVQFDENSDRLAGEQWIYSFDGQTVYLYFQHQYIIALGQGSSSAALD